MPKKSTTATNGTKSAERVKNFGEVYTNPREVCAMLDLVAQAAPQPDPFEQTFLEPACGNGAFLVEILARKLDAAKALGGLPERPGAGADAATWSAYVMAAARCVATIYAIDICAENVNESRARMYAYALTGDYAPVQLPGSGGDSCPQLLKFYEETEAKAGIPGGCGAALAVLYLILQHNVLQGDFLTGQGPAGPLCFGRWKFAPGVVSMSAQPLANCTAGKNGPPAFTAAIQAQGC